MRGNDATVQQIHDRNENLQQPRAPGSPDDEFDADELPDVVDMDDIIKPGMDAEVLMYDLLAVGYGVRRCLPPDFMSSTVEHVGKLQWPK
ncbi:hypothetical protein R1sor_003757 [Riccia sorocarpa]|uniref:Uncharacterized protein n=1 Tax=Riccia sorocarpa TaxID=122646 RepID=A0ABD3H5W0_9MARC